MARINFDDDIESQPQFRHLLKSCDNDWDAALGKLVRFFRIAQHAYGHSLSIPKKTLVDEGLICMIESGWAIETDGGYEAKGAKKHFSWYKQKVESGKNGGIASGIAKQGASLEIIDKSCKAGRDPAKPLSLSLSPSPSPSLKEKNIYLETNIEKYKTKENYEKKTDVTFKEQIDECTQAWGTSLARFGILKDPRTDCAAIAALLQRHGFEKTKLALLGAGLEVSTENYNASKHCRITRLTKPDIFEKFVNLGAQQKPIERKAIDGDTGDISHES